MAKRNSTAGARVAEFGSGLGSGSPTSTGMEKKDVDVKMKNVNAGEAVAEDGSKDKVFVSSYVQFIMVVF